jgi:hypothetical protein
MKLTDVLEHCYEGDSNFGSPSFGAFPFDHIPKVMKNVNVHVFIHTFTFMYELIMDSALAVKKKPLT